MKEKIINHVSELLPDLVEDIKTICSMDSRQDTATPEDPYGKRVTDCLNEALGIARRLGFETENVGNQVGIAACGRHGRLHCLCVTSGCGGCGRRVEDRSLCMYGKRRHPVCKRCP